MTQADNYLGTKVVQVVPPADYGAGVPTAGTLIEVDAIGFKWARFDFNLGTVDGDVGSSFRETATSGSGYSTISGAALTTVTSANDNQVHSVVINVKARLRYLRPLVTNTGTALPLGVTCTLSAAEDPVWATQSEVSAIV